MPDTFAILTCIETTVDTDDDAILLAAFTARGVAAEVVAWDDEQVDWRRFAAAILRTPWNYANHLDRFLAWLDRTAQQTVVLNDPTIVRWNIDKRYLAELHAAGVETVPTVFADEASLDDAILAIHARSESVAIKPCVGAGAIGLSVLAPGALLADDARAAGLGPAGVALVQPVIESVRTDGEVSVVVIGGRSLYAIRKLPKAGDLRVQAEWGGSYEMMPITPSLRAIGEAAVAACEAKAAAPTYARVDVVRPDPVGAPEGWAVMELEVIEPELFFAMDASGAEALVSAAMERAQR